MERSTVRDLIALSILAVACLALRLPAIDRLALNPDESQYEATASYLLATGESAFSLPYGIPWTMALYKGVAMLFGPYAMMEVRLLVLLIALLMAWMLYDLVRREAGRFWGGVAGLVSLHWVVYFEGLTANREWFSGFAALAGIYLYTFAMRREGRPRWLLLLLAGLVCGACLFFKRQASFLVLVAPLTMIWESIIERRLRRLPEVLVPFAVGGLLSGVVFVLPFVLHGTAGIYIGSLFADYTMFVGENARQTEELAGGSLGLFAHHLYGRLPFRGAVLLIYGFCGLVLTGAAVRVSLRDRPWTAPARPLCVLFALYFVAAVGCVQLGNRFLDHYYIYVIPPAAALLALAGRTLSQAVRDGTLAKFCLAIGALWLVDRGAAFSGTTLEALRSGLPGSLMLPTYLLLGTGIVAFGMLKPATRAGRMIALLVVLETGAMTLAQLQPAPPSFPYHRDGFARLVERIDRERAPGDRLFVWGWLPEVYSAVKMEAASHMTITQYVVDDYYVTSQAPRLNTEVAETLMDNLRERRPRFIVDAAERSWTLLADADPRLYRMKNYPDFELTDLLEQEYRFAGTLDGCDLYIRR